MRRRLLAAMVATTLAALLIPLVAGPASAHEEKTVGKYHFVVGFGDEPAYAGEKNSVQLILADANDKPVTDLTDTLKVEVTTGTAEPLQLAMEPNFEVGEFGTPGDYRAFFIPTAPGSYSFHFTGTIKGQKIDQTFTSGPQTFSDIDDPAQVQYPVKQPTGGQLATRVDPRDRQDQRRPDRRARPGQRRCGLGPHAGHHRPDRGHPRSGGRRYRPGQGPPVPRPGCAGRRPRGHDGATGPVTVAKDDICDAGGAVGLALMAEAPTASPSGQGNRPRSASSASRASSQAA